MKSRIFLTVAFAIAMVTSISAKSIEVSNLFPSDCTIFPIEFAEYNSMFPDIDPTEDIESESENTMNRNVEFPGGKNALKNFLSKNLKYPSKAYECNVQGTVICGFVVGADGRVERAWIVQSLSEECDAEVLRVISQMPKWETAIIDGSSVSKIVEIPISFTIKDGIIY